MSELKTSKYIITDVKPDKLFPGEQSGIGKKPESGHVTPTHVMWLDGDVIPGAFYSESVWIWPDCASDKSAAEAHTHDFTEEITFFGTDFENPKDLCGEVELWLGDEKHILTKSCMVFIPKGLTHCPLVFRRVDSPIFHFSAGPSGLYDKKQNK